MRDIAFTILIVCLVPYILRRPWIGVLTYIWLSLMTPYRFTYGFAYEFPFTAIVAVCTLVGLVAAREQVKYESSGLLMLMILFPLWMCVTWMTGLERAAGEHRVSELLKIFLMMHICSAVIHSRKKIDAMIWVIVISVGFYGVKGGLFTILSGGGGRVYGPPGDSYLSDNNAISVALIMVLPLMNYLRVTSVNVWIKRGLLGAMLLSGMAVLGSYSRGAFLAISAMLLFMWVKSSKKIGLALVGLALVPFAIGLMPDRWTDRMNTISTYEEDGSAMGRINSWTAAFNLANDRPIVGGGFEWYSDATFEKYAPNPRDVHTAHSIYFQMLGEHGYVGLLIFLSIGLTAWGYARKASRLVQGRPELVWAKELARAVQISIVGFSTGGAFVNIGYWDLIYYIALLTMFILREVTASLAASEVSSSPPIASRGVLSR